ncbi:MAG TPA: transketolase [Candidatus Baltobacteraceae bacterium]|nr:transketolase [Candidatus Baltobacteraceae bacterium]
MPNTPDVERRINAIRFLSIDAVQKANSGHPGLPLGAAALAYALWTRHLQHNPTDPHWIDRDRFVLSAGHGSMLLYALLYLTGYDLPLEQLKAFRQLGSKTPGHPEVGLTPGVEATTGPLGQGFGNAVGMAIAQAHLAATFNREVSIVDHFTYCLASDGDLMEGVASEAASVAGHLRLGKLIVLYDDNNVSLAGPTSVTFTEDVARRFEAYGWHTQTIDAAHGEDVEPVDSAIHAAKAERTRPSLILVRTVIGYGSPKQGTFKVHGSPLGPEDVAKTKERFGWPIEPAFYVPDDVLAWWRDNGARGAAPQAQWQQRYATWKQQNAELAARFERTQRGELPTNIAWPKINEEPQMTREVGGEIMNAIAADVTELIGGSADLDPSTNTYLLNHGDFQADSHAGRNLHFGVREHAMGAIVNGIALHGGLLPFSATFFNFLDYMKPAVRLAALSHLRAIFIFTHDSFYLGEDGPTHQPVEQLATLRATPNIAVIRPADALETLEAWKCAIAPKTGPTALILTRQKVPFLGNRRADVRRGAYVIFENTPRPELLLIASGSEVSLAIETAKILAAQGTAVRVVSMPCWEYFLEQDRAYHEEVLPPTVRARISIEAGATFGWERWIGTDGLAIGLDHFGESAPAGPLAGAFGFVPERIAEQARQLLEKLSSDLALPRVN